MFIKKTQVDPVTDNHVSDHLAKRVMHDANPIALKSDRFLAKQDCMHSRNVRLGIVGMQVSQ